MFKNSLTEKVDPGTKAGGLSEITRILEDAIDKVKTRQGDAIVILVGGGSVIVSDVLTGVGEVFRPKYLEVANAIGAAVSHVETTILPISVFTKFPPRLERSAALSILSACRGVNPSSSNLKTPRIWRQSAASEPAVTLTLSRL